MPVARQLDIQTRLIDAIHDLCFVLSSDNTILYCNRKAAEVFGHSEAQLRGLDFSTFIHDDVRDRWWRPVDASRDGGDRPDDC